MNKQLKEQLEEYLYKDITQKGRQMKIGDRVKVKDQDIFGKIIYDHGTEVIIEDEDAETNDNQLCFKKSEIETNESQRIHKHTELC